MWSSSSRCKVIKGVAEVWPWFMRAWWSADGPRDQRGEFTFPQAHICVWPPWMSWTNAGWSVQTSSPNSCKLGRLMILKRLSVITDIVNCFSCPRVISLLSQKKLLFKRCQKGLALCLRQETVSTRGRPVTRDNMIPHFHLESTSL